MNARKIESGLFFTNETIYRVTQMGLGTDVTKTIEEHVPAAFQLAPDLSHVIPAGERCIYIHDLSQLFRRCTVLDSAESTFESFAGVFLRSFILQHIKVPVSEIILCMDSREQYPLPRINTSEERKEAAEKYSGGSCASAPIPDGAQNSVAFAGKLTFPVSRIVGTRKLHSTFYRNLIRCIREIVSVL